jgi:sulfoxide reductase heme-binding subunit YedZ
MARRKGAHRIWYLALIGVVALGLVGGLISLQPYGSALQWLIRGAALLGYLAIFLSIVSSAYMKWMTRFFGRPFVKVHHILAVAGLVMITLHPLGAAIDALSLSVFLPRFDSLTVFFALGGRAAWYLIAAASLAAVLRRLVGQNWRVVHFLNYVAFLLGTVHAIMIGTDFLYTANKVVAVVLALVVVAIFVQQRLRRRKKGKRS